MKKILLLLLLLAGLTRTNAQGQLVKGKITDETDKPLAGASISLKGITVTTKTDEAGSFQVNTGTQVNPVLVVSFVGFSIRSIPLGAHWSYSSPSTGKASILARFSLLIHPIIKTGIFVLQFNVSHDCLLKACVSKNTF